MIWLDIVNGIKRLALGVVWILVDLRLFGMVRIADNLSRMIQDHVIARYLQDMAA